MDIVLYKDNNTEIRKKNTGGGIPKVTYTISLPFLDLPTLNMTIYINDGDTSRTVKEKLTKDEKNGILFFIKDYDWPTVAVKHLMITVGYDDHALEQLEKVSNLNSIDSILSISSVWRWTSKYFLSWNSSVIEIRNAKFVLVYDDTQRSTQKQTTTAPAIAPYISSKAIKTPASASASVPAPAPTYKKVFTPPSNITYEELIKLAYSNGHKYEHYIPENAKKGIIVYKSNTPQNWIDSHSAIATGILTYIDKEPKEFIFQWKDTTNNTCERVSYTADQVAPLISDLIRGEIIGEFYYLAVRRSRYGLDLLPYPYKVNKRSVVVSTPIVLL